jgi:hypothetical protein
MKDFYLKNGEKVRLIEKISDNRFLVESYMYYAGYEGDNYEDPSGIQIVVNEIFESVQPIYDKSIEVNRQKLSDLDKEISEKRKELNHIKNELLINSKKKSDLDRLLIDRSQFLTCKELVVFTKDRIIPTRRDGNARGLNMTIDINLVTGEEKRWSYKIYDDYTSSSDYVESHSDILFDPTEEEIEEGIKTRIKSGKFTPAQIFQLDDKYLTEEQIDLKYSSILGKQMIEYNKMEEKLNKGKEKMENLSLKMSQNIKWKKQEA